MYQGEKIVLALGFFDGVHLGHQALLNETIKIGKTKGYKTGVMTFREHPLELIFPKYAPWLITSNNEKEAMIHNLGIDCVFINDFNENLMMLSPEEFIVDYLLKKYNVKTIVVGFNYNFGYKGTGTINDLIAFGERFGFTVSVIPSCFINKNPVSSTFIRELISCGQVEEVKILLGRDYSITGKVVRGKGLGRQYGIPTANMQLKQKRLLPSTGVYFTHVYYQGQRFYGLTNLGFNPTFEKHPFCIETYIFDFDKDIYGDEITVVFMKKIRSEIKFETIDKLILQINEDIEHIKKYYIK